MGTAADWMWEQYEEQQEAEERAARLATPEGRQAELERERADNELERARREAERAKVKQERAWSRDHPEAWAAWQSIQPYWFDLFDFAGDYGFEQFLKEVGEFEPGHRLMRKDDRLPFQTGNIKWAVTPAEGLEHSLVERLLTTLGRVEDSLPRQPAERAPAVSNEPLTPELVGKMVQPNRSAFTVREWCREGKIQANKDKSLGRTGGWVIPYEEVERLRREGWPKNG
jgi:hypothetical protein